MELWQPLQGKDKWRNLRPVTWNFITVFLPCLFLNPTCGVFFTFFIVTKSTRGILELLFPPRALDQLWKKFCAVLRKIFKFKLLVLNYTTQSWAIIAFSESFDIHCFLRPRWPGTMLCMDSQCSLNWSPITLLHSFSGHPLMGLPEPHLTRIYKSNGFLTCLMQLEYFSNFRETTFIDLSSGIYWVSNRYFLALSWFGLLLGTVYFFFFIIKNYWNDFD